MKGGVHLDRGSNHWQESRDAHSQYSLALTVPGPRLVEISV